MVVEDEMLHTQELIHLHKLHQPDGFVPVSVERLHADGNLAFDGSLLVIREVMNLQPRSGQSEEGLLKSLTVKINKKRFK